MFNDSEVLLQLRWALRGRHRGLGTHISHPPPHGALQSLHRTMDNRSVINLQNLPVEILFAIFEHLSPLPPAPQPHPFLALSATTLTLRSALISFLRYRIVRQKSLSFNGLRTALSDPTRDISRYAPVIVRVWLRTTMSHCFACAKYTCRRAIMEPAAVCCAKCDEAHWPGKITLDDAVRKYGLKHEELYEAAMGPPSEVALYEPAMGPPPGVSGLTPSGQKRRRKLPHGHKSVSGKSMVVFMKHDIREFYERVRYRRCEWRRAMMREKMEAGIPERRRCQGGRTLCRSQVLRTPR